MDYEKEITDLASRITLLENKLNDEHQLRLGLEEELEAQNNKIEKGEFESITTTKINIKPEVVDRRYDGQETGIFMYSDDEKLLFETKISDKGNVETNFRSHKNEGRLEIGLCEHGAGRIHLKNTNGNSMVYLGSWNNEEDHSGRVCISDYSDNNKIILSTCNPLLESEYQLKNSIEILEYDENEKVKKSVYLGTRKEKESGRDDTFFFLLSGENYWEKDSSEKF